MSYFTHILSLSAINLGGNLDSLLLCRISLVAVRRSYSVVAMCGLLTAMASLIVEHRLYLGHVGFGSCG